MMRPKADLDTGNLKYLHKAAIVRYTQAHPAVNELRNGHEPERCEEDETSLFDT
jgi:hypothetical protein